MYSFEELLGIVRRLYGPGGCPWDREQTYETLKKYIAAETQEVIEAVDHQDMDNLCEELGDVLYEVLLFSAIAEERGDFTFEDVADGIARKMVRRHPNVFGDRKVTTAEEGLALWNEIKRLEKEEKARKSLTNKSKTDITCRCDEKQE